MAVSKLARERRTLISGDIKGVDQYALKQMLSSGGNVVGVLSDHLIDKIKEYKRYISKGKLCLISAIDPYAFFDVTNALDRNIYVCGLSSCQIIAAVLINSGAVWFTAIQNLHYNWTRQLVMEVPEYNGNLRLEEMGAIPISRDDLQSSLSIDEIIEKNNVYGEDEQPQIDQMSIFEFIGEKNG
jgi:predicted Rossmann fold nucleotide-binding protein DprA/Smf involved in DNA uptake